MKWKNKVVFHTEIMNRRWLFQRTNLLRKTVEIQNSTIRPKKYLNALNICAEIVANKIVVEILR